MRPTRLVGPIVGALVLAACGAPSDAGVTSPRPSSSSPTVAYAGDEPDTYTYELTATTVDGPSTLTLRASGAVDRTAGIAELRLDAEGFAGLAGLGAAPPPGEVVVIQSRASSHVLGVSEAVVGGEAPPEVDPAVWYEFDLFAETAPTPSSYSNPRTPGSPTP